MKKIYGIMRDGEISSSSLQKWKAQEYCDIMNESKGISDYVVSEAVICDGVVVSRVDIGYSVDGVIYASLDDLLISLGFIFS